MRKGKFFQRIQAYKTFVGLQVCIYFKKNVTTENMNAQNQNPHLSHFWSAVYRKQNRFLPLCAYIL